MSDGDARRSVGLGVGLAAAAAGLALVARPRLGAGLPLDEGLVAVVGLLSAGAGVGALYAWRRRTRSFGTPGAPEAVSTTGRPGTGFEEEAAQLAAATDRRTARSRREGLERRLERAAVAALRHRTGEDATAARERLAAGTWTDDPAAAAYFADESAEVVGTDGGEGLFPESPEERDARRARRAADAVAALTGVEGDDAGDDDPDDADDKADDDADDEQPDDAAAQKPARGDGGSADP